MKIEKIFCFITVAILCVFLCFGCRKSLPEDPEVPDQPVDPVIPEEPEIKLTSLKIGDRDISEYTVVYGTNPLRTTEVEGYDIPANAFVREISDRLGITLNTVESVFGEDYGPSIIFGNTYESKIVRPYYNDYKKKRQNGTSSEAFTLDEEFKIFSKEDTVYVLSDCPLSASVTVEHFFNDYIMSFCSLENSDVVLASDFSYTDLRERYVIGCVGDSITFGDGASKTSYVYPTVLQNILGYDDYQVINFGCGGKTICTNHMDTYTECNQYKNLVKYASELDMAIVWIGSNDADRFKDNWSDAVDEDFLASYRSLFSVLKTANPDMKIIIINPCYCAIDYWESSIEAHVLSLMERVAAESGFPMYDMHTFTRNTFTESDFHDNLHPSDSGYAIVAEKISELVHQYE